MEGDWPVPVGPGTAAALVRFGVVAPLLASAATLALARTARARCPRAGGWACWMVVLAMAYGLVAAADAAHCVPPARLRALRRGVNVAHWLSVDDAVAGAVGGDERSTPPWRRGPAAADLRLLRAAGFGHVRLPVSERLLLEEEEEGGGLAAVATAVRLALDAGLAAVVDLHPTPAFKAAVAGDGALAGLGFRRALASAPVGPLEGVWARLAAALAGFDPERVFLEVMNEPTFADPREWQVVQGRALAVMRAAAPRHTLVASANMVRPAGRPPGNGPAGADVTRRRGRARPIGTPSTRCTSSGPTPTATSSTICTITSRSSSPTRGRRGAIRRSRAACAACPTRPDLGRWPRWRWRMPTPRASPRRSPPRAP